MPFGCIEVGKSIQWPKYLEIQDTLVCLTEAYGAGFGGTRNKVE
jgi:hypothetical protein